MSKDPFDKLKIDLPEPLPQRRVLPEAPGRLEPPPKKPPWRRRDYSKALEVLDQVLDSGKDLALYGFATRRAATNNRFNFYKARSSYKKDMEDLADPFAPLQEQENYRLASVKYDAISISVEYTQKGWALCFRKDADTSAWKLEEII